MRGPIWPNLCQTCSPEREQLKRTLVAFSEVAFSEVAFSEAASGELAFGDIAFGKAASNLNAL